MSSPAEEYPDWTRIPVQLQYSFFDLAREQAERTKSKLLAEYEKLRRLRERLSYGSVPEGEDWKRWRITCVDGSDSAVMSERIGVRYGTYAAGYMVFQGDKLLEEDYASGCLGHGQFDDQEVSEKILQLLTTHLEREMALRCLREKDADLILIDGSFFGFSAGCEAVRQKRGVDAGRFASVEELISGIRDKSIELMKSRKAVGIIKRVRTQVIDGWLLYNDGDEDACIGKNDRAILSAIMPAKHCIEYDAFLKPLSYHAFRRFMDRYRASGKQALDRSKLEDLLKKAWKASQEGLKHALGGRIEEILEAKRAFYRASTEAPPFCFEFHKDLDVRPVLSYFLANCNPATGLPFPIDLADQNVSLPRRLTKEFVEEVEAILMRDPELERCDLISHFASLNPQKEE